MYDNYELEILLQFIFFVGGGGTVQNYNIHNYTSIDHPSRKNKYLVFQVKSVFINFKNFVAAIL